MRNNLKTITSNMEILELIETIAHGDRRQDTFYFTMVDGTARLNN